MFCPACGTSIPSTAKFCPVCGKQIMMPAVLNLCPACGAQTRPGDSFCPQCGHGLKNRPAAARAATRSSSQEIPANVVPKTMIGKRVIDTNREFTHEELLQFMSTRWNAMEYNHIVTDPSMKRYTDLYVVLPATSRYMVAVYSRDKGGTGRVILSIIKTPAGAAEMMLRAIPTQNVFFGIAQIAGTMSNKADREGPTEDALQRYADYMHHLLKKAGYLA